MTTFYALKRKTTGTMEPMLYKRIEAAQTKADKHGLYEVVPLFAAAEACVPVAETAGEAVVGWAYETEQRKGVRERHVILNRPDGEANPPTKHHGVPVYNVRALYAAPVPAQDDDKLRIAVEEALADVEYVPGDHPIVPVKHDRFVKAIRHALKSTAAQEGEKS
jgi:hypothetical protein